MLDSPAWRNNSVDIAASCSSQHLLRGGILTRHCRQQVRSYREDGPDATASGSGEVLLGVRAMAEDQIQMAGAARTW